MPTLRFLLLLLLSSLVTAFGQVPRSARTHPAATGEGSLKVITGHAGSVVFINNIRHGTTSDKGEVDLKHVRVGSFPVRVRTAGYVDWKGSVTIRPGGDRSLNVNQVPTSDEALLHYQKAEDLRDRAKNDDAVKEYQQALAARSDFPEAEIGMARSLITLQRFDQAEKQLAAASHAGPHHPEAQTVLANLRRYQGLVDESIVEYRKALRLAALRLAAGVSAEAHVGLAIALEESGKTDEAIKEYRAGIAQDMDTEPILYYLLGSLLEKHNRNKEAIDAYREYLRLDPEGQYASAVESMIEKLKEERQ
jgi:predicted Zn-dependent protease